MQCRQPAAARWQTPPSPPPHTHNTPHTPHNTQVVVLAAGFDSTAYRLQRPGVKFFELDLPHASERKRALVDEVLPDAQAYPRPAYIAADLVRC